MDVHIQRGGSWSKAFAGDDRDCLYKLLDKVLSYPVPGAEWAESYQLRVWDGRARLHSRPRNQGCVRFPSGLVDKVVLACRRGRHAVDVTDARPPFAVLGRLGRWTGPTPYRHQRAATKAVLAAYGDATINPTRPPGAILRLPVRSGKTLIAALVSHRIGLPVLFVVPSDHLLHQTQDAFAEYLGSITIGQFAAGQRELHADVIVATPQTLARAVTTRFYNKLRKQRRLLVIDEVHHKDDGGVWREAVLGLEPVFTLGLSATFKLSETPEYATSTIWLRGICGPVVYSMSVSDLIEARYLVRPTVHWIAHNAPRLSREKRTGPQLYKEGIADCKERNDAIVDVSARYAGEGHCVLIDLDRIGQTRMLAAALRCRLGSRHVAHIVGSTTTSRRKKIVASFRRGDIKVVAGTVLGEGVDIPELTVVVNGCGGRGYIPTMQRFRCLTPAPGKKKAVMVDFIDDHHPQLLKATEDRMQIYEAEPAFRFKIEE